MFTQIYVQNRRPQSRTWSDVSSASPGYNLLQVDEEHYQIEVPVLGWSEQELSLTQSGTQLRVRSDADAETSSGSAQYLQQHFQRADIDLDLQLAEHVEIKSARVANGILAIELIKQLPEALKPRTIRIESELAPEAQLTN